MLTPTGIDNKQFKRSLCGYHIDGVNDFLDQIIRDFDLLMKENTRLKLSAGLTHQSSVHANYCPNCGYHLSGDRD